MKYITAISAGDRGTKEDAKALLKSFNIETDQGSLVCAMGAWKWHGIFDTDDPRWKRLADWEKSNGHEPFIVHRIEYSDTDLRLSKFMEFDFDIESKGDIGPSEGTEYNFTTACPYCKSGAIVIPPFYIKASTLPRKRSFAASYQHISLVHGELLEELQARPGSQNWLVPMSDSKSGDSLPWAAILPTTTLPRMEKSTKGFFRDVATGKNRWGPCPQCDQDNWSTTMKEPFQPVYSRSKVREACKPFLYHDQEFPDAAATWERTFSGARPTGPDKVSTPLVFVNQEVYQILRKHAGKYLRATPATLVD